MDEYVIIIPTLNPNEKLVSLIGALKALGFQKIVVWNDGSGPEYENIWEKVRIMDCSLGNHEKNIGKGAAIKSAIAFAHKMYGQEKGYITVDGDGQHLPEDVKRVAEQMRKNPQELVLGVRDFSQKGIPFRSVFGNRMTSLIFRISTGLSCPDTQTGLRGIPASMREFALNVEGARYEYEMNFLTEAVSKYSIQMISIKTVYEDKNQVSHFRPVRDSILVYQRFCKYTVASLGGAAVDYLAFWLFLLLLPFSQFHEVWLATVLARILSGVVNYTLNHYWSFRSHAPVQGEVVRYGILFVSQMCISAVCVALLSEVIPTIIAKLLVDTTLFLGSFFIQKKWVFRTTV